jgi:hypothetical protein
MRPLIQLGLERQLSSHFHGPQAHVTGKARFPTPTPPARGQDETLPLKEVRNKVLGSCFKFPRVQGQLGAQGDGE